jgi:hypothetical protein
MKKAQERATKVVLAFRWLLSKSYYVREMKDSRCKNVLSCWDNHIAIYQADCCDEACWEKLKYQKSG